LTDLRRRSFLRASVAATLLVSGIDDILSEVKPMNTTQPGDALGRVLEPKALPFDPKTLRGLSERLIVSHWQNNYGGAVKALNTVREKLRASLAGNDPPYVYNDLKREHLIRTGSVVLHELYFANLGGDGKAPAEVRSALERAFGSYEAWETEYRRIGQGLGGGSGWVVLGFNEHLGFLENYWLADHASNPAHTRPILVMDMYEHSYHMDYGADAGKYVDAFFANIQWESAAQRLRAG
jgi:Fe-Mn family superoxide dismutase